MTFYTTDLGATTSGVSIAHVNDPFNIITVLSWDDSKEPSETFFSSILYSKDGNDTPKCGMQRDDANDVGVYVDNISQYLLDIDASDEKLGQLMDGLTVRKVITDYLKDFVQLALKRLQVHDKLIKNEYFQEFANEEFIEEDIKTICYCLVCPTDRQEFMKDCFIEAGIIEESEAEHRLSFVIQAVAIAHYQLSLDRNETGIENDQYYFVLDISDISIGIARIHAASTESLSTITGISDDITQGFLNLDIKFKEYLIENMTALKLDTSLIDQLIQTFSDKIKYRFNMNTPTRTAILQKNVDGNLIEFTYADLNRIVLNPFIEGIHELVAKANKTHGQHKMFLSANGSIGEYFVENLIAREKGRLKLYYHAKGVSSGAVSSKISTYKSQISFFFNDEHQPLFSDKKGPLRETTIEEPTDNNNENDAYDFIVGIDFGTIFSGCSYVQLKDKSGIPVDTKEIKTIKTGWPGGNLNTFGKTPTLLMYDMNMNPQYWGEVARLESKRHKDLDLLGNFKLFLCPKSLENFYDRTDNLEELKGQGGFVDDRTPKNVTDVVKIIADYLKLFKNHVIEYIVSKEMEEKFGYFTRARLLKKHKIKYVITVPAMWNSLARNTMAQAAIKATIIKKDEIDQLFIISEPEAAALFCMKRMTENFKKEDEELNDTNFIVCDAGEGTVDLVTFNLQLNNEEGGTPTTKPIICQIGDGIGDICGSTSLDVRFKNYLHKFYKSFGVDIDKENILLDGVMNDFVKNYKLKFMPNLQDGSYYDINLPGKGIRNYTSDSTYRMTNANKTLKMKNQVMKEQIFDPVVDRIFYLIDDQLSQAKKLDRRIDAILMVGGFSQSPYLKQSIKDRYKGMYRVSFPTGCVETISYGAVCYGLNPRTILRTTATQSLGLEVQAPFDKILPVSSKRIVKGPDGDWNFEKDRIEYFVKKGHILNSGQHTVYKKDVYVLYPNAAVIVGIDGRLIHFTIILQMTHIKVTVGIECKDQLINAEVRKITKNRRSSLEIKHICSPNVARFKRPLVSYSLKKTDYLFNIREALQKQ
ncbi:uncharacterized protein EV154DRAFT_577412 [Mucor mucedo]|uniref:uncharacterized protein n=1 Tax=Mucor mucedo TaxID=29922 RepID=UPI00221E6B51|nr:uncharacterized protein EV154DRAFT_577412 [Mucor mucedo]KAI7894666.1 hypothetical protein EV154DRAFT_577412 [Mucor mucedo]